MIENKTAFTLAEVIIVLGIIGIVAEMTIPTLINNVNEGFYKASYKKTYSIANQIFIMATTDSKIDNNPNGTDGLAKVNNFNTFKSYFKVAKDCSAGNNSDCWVNGENLFGHFPSAGAKAFIDISGVVWSLADNEC